MYFNWTYSMDINRPRLVLATGEIWGMGEMKRRVMTTNSQITDDLINMICNMRYLYQNNNMEEPSTLHIGSTLYDALIQWKNFTFTEKVEKGEKEQFYGMGIKIYKDRPFYLEIT
jgi:hypothetical protein